MNVSSVNNISFSGKKTDKKLKSKNKEQYYRYVSQFHANDALKLSVGREVEDGKYKAASAATLFAGFVGTCVSMIASFSISSKARALKASENVTQQAVNKLAKKINVTIIKEAESTLEKPYIHKISINASPINPIIPPTIKDTIAFLNLVSLAL
jgi:hypothetical protein